MIRNKVMVTAGVVTLLQALGQFFLAALGLAQYFCVIDFMRGIPLMLYIRILYFHNPGPCGARINIGESIDSITNQAFVLITQESMPVFRTFIINCTSLGLCVLWIFSSICIIMGGGKNDRRKIVRLPWVIITLAICVLDLVATVIYANDSFHTRTLSDIMEFVNGVASGLAGAELDTQWASWVMVLLYSRLVVLFAANLLLLVFVIVDCNADRRIEVDTGVQVEAPTISNHTSTIDKDIETESLTSNPARIPRPGLSRSFRRMKEFLFKKPSPPPARTLSNADSISETPDRSPRAQHVNIDKKTVNFPDNLLSLPQRLENLIAEQQRRLDKAVIDTSGRLSPPRASQSMPHLNLASTSTQDNQGRGTAVELQGQLPWAYIPASAHRMRDQLPPDEDLPPVPLPDYTAIQPFRKASVHRAASSLSSLIQKREALGQSRATLTQSDVLY
ncbi:uncharacterized protein LOC128682833 isoform X2 [Plodia interpunctella]|uniref:uncharacterized protein LOC128682833 isoform X2 n=1 Tax=Plodia interpunctella TaxID=58824 RepID=UPI00236877F5|nr:uncharacterized protein LOC128682833 isoform X2 [Plodia interpunctella]